MKYRIVQNVDGEWITSEPTDIIAWANVTGRTIVGYMNRPKVRAELQGQPMFSDLCGPMWDGDAIRYEDQRSNDILSA